MSSYPFQIQRILDLKPIKIQQKPSKLWTYQQMVRYAFFLNDYLQSHLSTGQKIMSRFDFQSMSEVIKTRNTNQCRIFHHKMLKIKENLKEVFEFFSESIEQYSNLYLDYREQKDTMKQSLKKKREDIDPYLRLIIPVPPEEKNKEGDEVHTPTSSLNFQFEVATEYDWFEEFSCYLASLQKSWLDEV